MTQGSPSEEALLESMLETAELLGAMGNWELIAGEPERVIWSDNLFRLFGFEPGEVEPSVELALAQTHPDDLERTKRQMQRVKTGTADHPFEYRITRPDGEIRFLRSTVTLVEAHPRRVLGCVQDITEERRADRKIQTHVALGEALGRWQSIQEGGSQLLQALGEGMGFIAGGLWEPEEEGLIPRVFWQADEGTALADLVHGSHIPRGSGLAGGVWESVAPASLDSILDDPIYGQLTSGPLAHVRGAVAFPAMKGDRVLAVLELFSPEPLGSRDRLLRSLGGIGRELGSFLDGRRGGLPLTALTPRELDVLQLAAYGHPLATISDELVVSQDTVKTHFRHIYSKLDVHDRATAVAQALRMGLIE